MKEFEDAELIEGEQETLETERDRLSNAEGIKRSLGGAFQYLTEAEQSIISQLETIGLSLSQIEQFDPEIKNLVEKIPRTGTGTGRGSTGFWQNER